jgi:hypothetical protein
MNHTGILRHVLPAQTDLVPFYRVTELESLHAVGPDPLRRLSALAVSGPGDAAALRNRLKLSNREYERITLMSMPSRRGSGVAGETAARIYLYRHGAEAFTDHAILAWARSDENVHDPAYTALLHLPRDWPPPTLPIRGSDVLALGIPPGPRVGEIVSAFEEWWIGAGFPNDPARCAAELRRLAVQIVNLVSKRTLANTLYVVAVALFRGASCVRRTEMKSSPGFASNRAAPHLIFVVLALLHLAIGLAVHHMPDALGLAAGDAETSRAASSIWAAPMWRRCSPGTGFSANTARNSTAIGP